MRCAVCGGEMTPLFFTMECERCLSPHARTTVRLERGYIVWRSRPPGSSEYVFKSQQDAERWRTASGLDAFPIRAVLSRTPFRWRRSTGSVRDVELADKLFEIFPSDDPSASPSSAFLDAA